MQFNTWKKTRVLIKSFIVDVFNQHDLTAIDKYLSPNLTDGTGKTTESFKKFY